MTWPQIVIALWLGYGVASGVVETVRDRSIPSTRATTMVMILLVLMVLQVYVLHCGGFW